MLLGLAHTPPAGRAPSPDTHWVLEQASRYPDLSMIDLSDQVEVVPPADPIEGLIVDAVVPTPEIREQVLSAHALGKPVLAFIGIKCPTSALVGELAGEQASPYPLAEWLSYHGNKRRAISVSRGLMQDVKLRVWLRAHFDLVLPGSDEL